MVGIDYDHDYYRACSRCAHRLRNPENERRSDLEEVAGSHSNERQNWPSVVEGRVLARARQTRQRVGLRGRQHRPLQKTPDRRSRSLRVSLPSRLVGCRTVNPESTRKVTTLRRREGTLYPRAARIGGIRVYQEADVELLRRRGTVPPRVAGGK